MRCENIILLAYLEGDQDLELIDNVAALQKKYAGYVVKDKPVGVSAAMAKPGVDIVPMLQACCEQELEAARTTADNGLYVLIHAGATTSNPKPDVLARDAAALIKSGVRLRKINLAGCFTGGNKLGNVDKSVLKQFCDELLKLFADDKAPLAGLHVAAYLTQVTTLDEDSGYYMGLSSKAVQLPQGPFNASKVHNLVQGGTKEQPRLMMTHPQVGAEQLASVEQHVGAMTQATMQAPSIKKLRKPFGAFTPEEHEKFLAQLPTAAKKASIEMPKADADVMMAYEAYMRTKVAVCFNAASGGFEPCSLAQFTDNETVRRLVTQVSRMNAASKFAFHL